MVIKFDMLFICSRMIKVCQVYKRCNGGIQFLINCLFFTVILQMKCHTHVFVKSYEFIFWISDHKETTAKPTTSSSTTGSTTKSASSAEVTTVCNIHKNSLKFIENFLRWSQVLVTSQNSMKKIKCSFLGDLGNFHFYGVFYV